MPGQACVFKAFRASLTLVPARYIAPADAALCGDLPLGLGRVVVQSIAADNDPALPVIQTGIHAAAHPPAGIPGVQVLQHGVVHSDDIHQRQRAPLPRRLQGVRQRDLPLQLPLRPKMH